MAAKREPLSWEVLDYWKATGLPFCASVPGSTVVYRKSDGSVGGLAALSARRDTALSFLVEPLIADSGPIALKVIDCLEQWMIESRLPGYVFYVPEDLPWRQQIERLVKEGIFIVLGKRKSDGHHLYGRKF